VLPAAQDEARLEHHLVGHRVAMARQRLCGPLSKPHAEPDPPGIWSLSLIRPASHSSRLVTWSGGVQPCACLLVRLQAASAALAAACMHAFIERESNGLPIASNGKAIRQQHAIPAIVSQQLARQGRIGAGSICTVQATRQPRDLGSWLPWMCGLRRSTLAVTGIPTHLDTMRNSGPRR